MRMYFCHLLPPTTEGAHLLERDSERCFIKLPSFVKKLKKRLTKDFSAVSFWLSNENTQLFMIEILLVLPKSMTSLFNLLSS
jgi:hypothetical protein